MSRECGHWTFSDDGGWSPGCFGSQGSGLRGRCIFNVRLVNRVKLDSHILCSCRGLDDHSFAIGNQEHHGH